MKTLMPRESLVEANFAENFSYEDDRLNEDEFLSSTEFPSYPVRESVRESMTKRVLIETDFQKLMLAKSKLGEILKITESLHEKNHWN
jgi:hypothetical protein